MSNSVSRIYGIIEELIRTALSREKGEIDHFQYVETSRELGNEFKLEFEQAVKEICRGNSHERHDNSGNPR